MKLYVVGSSKNNFLPLDDIREKFLIDVPHEGENIDDRNSLYCELTGLYYLWKNCTDDIVGLEHYRRNFGDNKLLDKSTIEKILSENDIICCKSWDAYGIDLASRFNRGWAQGSLADELKYLKFAVKYRHPELFDHLLYFLNAHDHYQFNMFICRKEIINEYCEFAFPILNDIFAVYGPKLKLRSVGFLAEIVLFTFFIKMKQLKVYESKVILSNFKKIGYR